MILGLELYIGNMGFTKFLYIKVDVGPYISTTDEFQYFVLSEMIYKNIAMVILGYLYIEIISRWYIDSVVKEKETRRVS